MVYGHTWDNCGNKIKGDRSVDIYIMAGTHISHTSGNKFRVVAYNTVLRGVPLGP